MHLCIASHRIASCIHQPSLNQQDGPPTSPLSRPATPSRGINSTCGGLFSRARAAVDHLCCLFNTTNPASYPPPTATPHCSASARAQRSPAPPRSHSRIASHHTVPSRSSRSLGHCPSKLSNSRHPTHLVSPTRYPTSPTPSPTPQYDARPCTPCPGANPAPGEVGARSERADVSSSAEVRMLGVTPPISMDPPKDADAQASDGG